MNENNSNQELYHYGVLGMKWGVRKNPSKAYSKAMKKKQKLETKEAKSQLKAAKYKYSAAKKMAKATSEKKAKKARDLEFKGIKYELKSAKYKNKGLKWTRKMEKVFAGYDIRRVSDEERRNGQKYIYEVLKRETEED